MPYHRIIFNFAYHSAKTVALTTVAYLIWNNDYYYVDTIARKQTRTYPLYFQHSGMMACLLMFSYSPISTTGTL